MEYDFSDLAKSAYSAYGKFTSFKNFQGNQMPEWSALPERIQQAWVASVKQTFSDVAKILAPNDSV